MMLIVLVSVVVFHCLPILKAGMMPRVGIKNFQGFSHILANQHCQRAQAWHETLCHRSLSCASFALEKRKPPNLPAGGRGWLLLRFDDSPVATEDIAVNGANDEHG